MSKKKDTFEPSELWVAVLGILSILFLEILALLKGVDGVMFGAAMTGIGVIIGWVFKSYHSKYTKRRK